MSPDYHFVTNCQRYPTGTARIPSWRSIFLRGFPPAPPDKIKCASVRSRFYAQMHQTLFWGKGGGGGKGRKKKGISYG